MSETPAKKEACRALHRAAHLPMHRDEQIGADLLPVLSEGLGTHVGKSRDG